MQLGTLPVYLLARQKCDVDVTCSKRDRDDNQTIYLPLAYSLKCMFDAARAITALVALNNSVNITHNLLAFAWATYAQIVPPLDIPFNTEKDRRYSKYFKNIIELQGHLPNPLPLKLHHINIDFKTSYPVTLELKESGVKIFSLTSTRTNFAFKEPLTLLSDIQIHLFNREKSRIMEFHFHTGFMRAGLIRVNKEDLDQIGLVAGMDIIFSDFRGCYHLIVCLGDNINLRGQSYSRYLEKSLQKCLVRLVNHHVVSIDQSNVASLSTLGCSREIACYALQRCNNDMIKAKDLIKSLLRDEQQKGSLINDRTIVPGPRKESRILTQNEELIIPNSTKRSNKQNVTSIASSTGSTNSIKRLEDLLEQASFATSSKYKSNSMTRLENLLTCNPSPRLSTSSVKSDSRVTSPSKSFNSLNIPESRNTLPVGTKVRKSRNLEPAVDGLVAKRSLSKQVNGASADGLDEDISPMPPHKLNSTKSTFSNAPVKTQQHSSLEAILDSIRSRPVRATQDPIDRLNELSSITKRRPLSLSNSYSSASSTVTSAKLDDLLGEIELFCSSDVEEEDETFEDEPIPNIAWDKVIVEIEQRSDAQQIDSTSPEIIPVENTSPRLLQPILFSDIPQSMPDYKPTKKTKFANLLPLRRANNICIVLSRYNRRNLTSHAIIGAITDLDSRFLNIDDLIAISGILPTLSEEKLLLGYTGPVGKLAPAETFLRLSLKTPGLLNMLEVFIFKLGVDLDVEAIVSGINSFERVCNGLRGSDLFKVLLRCVYSLASVGEEIFAASEGYRPWMGKNARSIGYKIDGLVRILDIKSADGRWRLIDFLVRICWETQADVLNVCDDFPELSFVATYDTRDFVSQYTDIRAKLELLRKQNYTADFIEIFNPVLAHADKLLCSVEDAIQRLDRAFQETAIYLGEDLNLYYGILDTVALVNGKEKVDTFEGVLKKLPMEIFIRLALFIGEFSDAGRTYRALVAQSKP